MSKAIITDVDVQKRLIKNLNDRPNAAATYGGAKKSANDIKAAFDEQFEFLADKHNELIREIGDVDKYSENESERIEAENERAVAEAERADAEEIRAVSEASRALAETERVAAEADREDAESAREAAENERVIAEGERDEFIGDLDSAVDELLKLQEDILDGRAEAIAKEEVIKAINETLLIANDLETDDPYKALSAAQGVILSGLVSEKVRMESGWYNGTNKSGMTNSLDLAFSFVPRLVIIVYRIYCKYSTESSYTTKSGVGFILPQNNLYVRVNEDESGVEVVGRGGTDNRQPIVSVEGTTVKLCYPHGGSDVEDHANIFNVKSSYDPIYGNSVQSAGYGYTYYAFG
jgi:hypothetical protein